MNDITSPAAGAQTGPGDAVDAIVGLTPADPLYGVRHARHKVVHATQGSYELFFDPSSQGLPIQERLLVAWHASILSRSVALTQHYRDALADHVVDASAIAAIEGGRVDDLPPSRLRAMLIFTGKLILKPVDGDKAALEQLRDAGMATPDIVTLAQLVAFLSYQIRLVAGLSAMKALESL
ncbi:CMD domain protein [Pollutimonas sp. H1-120]|uniref:CMD domain-containing protein n=1 Tax=Pollutimonas sp. H1-120 TaxID=3148824 RepID=UPI003B52B9A9